MSKSIYRKLKDYIQRNKTGTTLIFGDLMSRDCCYQFEDGNGDWFEWVGTGIYGGEMDDLLNFYVVGIRPDYRIEKDKIIPFLRITLCKENPDYE